MDRSMANRNQLIAPTIVEWALMPVCALEADNGGRQCHVGGQLYKVTISVGLPLTTFTKSDDMLLPLLKYYFDHRHNNYKTGCSS